MRLLMIGWWTANARMPIVQPSRALNIHSSPLSHRDHHFHLRSLRSLRSPLFPNHLITPIILCGTPPPNLNPPSLSFVLYSLFIFSYLCCKFPLLPMSIHLILWTLAAFSNLNTRFTVLTSLFKCKSYWMLYRLTLLFGCRYPSQYLYFLLT